jgi:drug/metabolite transporter (DMT)-like permease
MTYVQLIVATLLGWLLFGDKPDAVAMFGAAIIVGAGLYLWYVARRREAVK